MVLVAILMRCGCGTNTNYDSVPYFRIVESYFGVLRYQTVVANVSAVSAAAQALVWNTADATARVPGTCFGAAAVWGLTEYRAWRDAA